MHVCFQSDAVYGYDIDDFTHIDDNWNDWVRNASTSATIKVKCLIVDFSYTIVEFIQRKEDRSNNFELEGSER